MDGFFEPQCITVSLRCQHQSVIIRESAIQSAVWWVPRWTAHIM